MYAPPLKMKMLVTGSAGFIGFHLVERLLSEGHQVVGIDNLNPYYDPALEVSRLRAAGIEDPVPGSIVHARQRSYGFLQGDITNSTDLKSVFDLGPFDCVCHLAAQAGVRFSLEQPLAYVHANIVGTTHLLEACRSDAPHFLFASSSSVYGLNQKMPYSVHDNTDHPVSIYAASKKASELIVHSYSHLFGIPSTGLRFFTAYGPWGRPDMALFKFTQSILKGEPIQVYNNGRMQRDFTFIDDIVTGVVKLAHHIPQPDEGWDANHPDPSTSSAPYRIHNIGNSRPTELLDYVRAIERALGKQAVLEMLPAQPGDVTSTWADTSELQKEIDFIPDTAIDVGVSKFVAWFRQYYNV